VGSKNQNLVVTVSRRRHRRIDDAAEIESITRGLKSWQNFKKRFLKGQVLSPTGPFTVKDTYYCNPYGRYETQTGPYSHFLTAIMPKGIVAMLRVVSLEYKSQAWSIALLREKKQLKLPNGVTLNWTPG
jgi:hypothetical protein